MGFLSELFGGGDYDEPPAWKETENRPCKEEIETYEEVPSWKKKGPSPKDIDEPHDWSVGYEGGTADQKRGWYIYADSIKDGKMGPFATQQRAIQEAQQLPNIGRTIEVTDRGSRESREVDVDEEDPEVFEGSVWTVWYDVDDFEGPGWWVSGVEVESELVTYGPYGREEAMRIAEEKAKLDGYVRIKHTEEDAEEIYGAYNTGAG
jgi:hypothetical protein